MTLRVLAVSVAPLFPGVYHGGSQRVLVAVARALADAGHRVKVICARRAENATGFSLAPDVSVEPLLRLKGFFPDPYQVPPHRLADTVRQLGAWMEWADRVYLHADIFHFRSILRSGVPVVRSFHDFHYETALISAFAYGADLTIVPSDYLRRCLEATVGRSGVRALEPVWVIPNGIDLDRFRPMSASRPAGVAPRRDGELILLHPHRPDSRKGVHEALELVADLRRRRAAEKIRLIVPRHVDAESSVETATYYDRVRHQADQLGISEAVEFVPWQSDETLPQLYSFADVTLCLGNFIESFGLTAYESIACGTHAVLARVGAFRHAPDHPDLHVVEYGDTDSASEAVMQAARRTPATESARELLAANFGIDRMVGAYVQAIEVTQPIAPAGRPAWSLATSTSGVQYELAPWCHMAGDRIYNDYAYRHLDFPKLARALRASAGAHSETTLLASNVPRAELDAALETGTLIPIESVSA